MRKKYIKKAEYFEKSSCFVHTFACTCMCVDQQSKTVINMPHF